MSSSISAVIRSKNEAAFLEASVRQIAQSVDEIIIVDNLSTDASIPNLKSSLEAITENVPIRFYEYPHDIARVGTEHLKTPADSPRSLVSFYNFSFKKATAAWALKWDADMFLSPRGERVLQYVRNGLDNFRTFSLGRTPVYLINQRAFSDFGHQNYERFLYHNDPYVAYEKALLFEKVGPTPTPLARIPGALWEFKLVKQFREEIEGTWTSISDVEAFGRSRKQRELEVFRSLAEASTQRLDRAAQTLGLKDISHHPIFQASNNKIGPWTLLEFS